MLAPHCTVTTGTGLYLFLFGNTTIEFDIFPLLHQDCSATCFCELHLSLWANHNIAPHK